MHVRIKIVWSQHTKLTNFVLFFRFFFSFSFFRQFFSHWLVFGLNFFPPFFFLLLCFFSRFFLSCCVAVYETRSIEWLFGVHFTVFKTKLSPAAGPNQNMHGEYPSVVVGLRARGRLNRLEGEIGNAYGGALLAHGFSRAHRMER